MARSCLCVARDPVVLNVRKILEILDADWPPRPGSNRNRGGFYFFLRNLFMEKKVSSISVLAAYSGRDNDIFFVMTM